MKEILLGLLVHKGPTVVPCGIERLRDGFHNYSANKSVFILMIRREMIVAESKYGIVNESHMQASFRKKIPPNFRFLLEKSFRYFR